MPTNVPAPTLTPTGFAVPEELAILTGLFADFQAAFGGALNPGLYTPQGQLATSLAALVGSNNDQFLLLANQVDPAFADGRMQDAIARIYFLERNPPLSTSVAVVLTGAPGTSVPAGSLAQATDGTIYQALGDTVISSVGTSPAQFQALDTGPIDCPTDTLTRIYRAIPGWDAISNPSDGVPGRDVETRAEFEQRRANSVALNAIGVLPAIRAAVLNVPGVLDAYVTENSGAASRTVAGVGLPAHSLYVAVVGGTDADVARAIWAKKNPGCDYYGNTTVTVQDTGSGYGVPYPQYDVTFQRPDALPVYVSVELANNTGIPADAGEQIDAVVLAAFNGLDGGPRARIGATLFASRFYAGIARLGNWVQIVSVSVGTSASPTADRITVDMDQVPTLDAANITVALV
jgi:uncharacterized phage protein gp47/JayE